MLSIESDLEMGKTDSGLEDIRLYRNDVSVKICKSKFKCKTSCQLIVDFVIPKIKFRIGGDMIFDFSDA